jgi:hypothetical protein
MKRYLLIENAHYYPCAGTGDWVGTFETEEDAEKHAREGSSDTYTIVDLMDWMTR